MKQTLKYAAAFGVSLSSMVMAGCSDSVHQPEACTPPLATWSQAHPHMGPDFPIFHVALDRSGAMYLEGVRATPEELAVQLEAIRNRRMLPEPAFILETEMGAPCAALDEVRSIMNERLACGTEAGHCDEGVQTIWNGLTSTGPVP